MKHALILSSAALSFVLLAGCKPSTHTVDWYTKHKTERAAKVKECENDAAKQVSADCQNAMASKAKDTVFGNGSMNSPDISIN